MKRPDLTIKQILAWADHYHAKTGKWPKMKSGRIVGSLGETWLAIDKALRNQGRGIAIPGMSLARLLEERRGVRNTHNLPRLTVRQIVTWAVEHFERTEMWPIHKSGLIVAEPRENWQSIDSALRLGLRGLLGRSSLSRVISAHRGGARPHHRPVLKTERIIEWARAYLRRFGHLPTERSGRIPGTPGLTWSAVSSALQVGLRGLTPGTTLSRLLRAHFKMSPGRRYRRPDLSVDQILKWADQHRKRTGRWPIVSSGSIVGSQGNSWLIVDAALKARRRGLSLPGMTLARLLAARRGVRHRSHLPRLSVRQICLWVLEHRRRTGKWPTAESGVIPSMAGETWASVDGALRKGTRGLSGRTSLSRFLIEHYDFVPPRHHRSRMRIEEILKWAKAYRDRFETLPHQRSGPITEAPGTTWYSVDYALRKGYRGLPCGLSLRRLFKKHFDLKVRRPIAKRLSLRPAR
jgi:hypothetical protein